MTRSEQYESGRYHNRVMHTRSATTHAAFFLPYLKPGMSLLDCGCGPGSITLGLAEAVAPGMVVGIDIGEGDIETANSFAKARGVLNTEFQVASVYRLPFLENSFDTVFAHGVLEHLASPLDALKQMHRVLKSGGLAGLRSPDYAGHLYAPQDPAIDESLKLIEDFMRSNGGDRHRGKHLRALMREAGFVDVEGSASYDYAGTPEAARIEGENMAAIFSEKSFRNQVIELRLADEAILQKMALAWESWGRQPDAFRASIWCEAVGRKP